MTRDKCSSGQPSEVQSHRRIQEHNCDFRADFSDSRGTLDFRVRDRNCKSWGSMIFQGLKICTGFEVFDENIFLSRKCKMIIWLLSPWTRSRFQGVSCRYCHFNIYISYSLIMGLVSMPRDKVKLCLRLLTSWSDHVELNKKCHCFCRKWINGAVLEMHALLEMPNFCFGRLLKEPAWVFSNDRCRCQGVWNGSTIWVSFYLMNYDSERPSLETRHGSHFSPVQLLT